MTGRIKKAKANLLEDTADTTTPEQWQVEFTHAIVQEVHRLIEEQGRAYGPEFSDLARLNVIASLVATTVYSILGKFRKPRGATAIQLQTANETHHLAYREITEAVQNAVASGFEGAVKTWSGQNTEYHCMIQIVPEPINKEAC